MLLLCALIALSLGDVCKSVECPPKGYNQLDTSGSGGNRCRRQVVNPIKPDEMITETEVAPGVSYWACPKGCHVTGAGCDTGAEKKMCIAGHKNCDDADAYFSLDGGYVSPYCSMSKDACYKCSQRKGKYCVDGKQVSFDERGNSGSGQTMYFSTAKNFPCLGRDILGSCTDVKNEKGCGTCSESHQTCTLCRTGLNDGMCQFNKDIQKDTIGVCVSDCKEWFMYTEEVCETVLVPLRGRYKDVFIRRPNARYQGTWASNGFRNWLPSGVPGSFTEDGHSAEYRSNVVVTDVQRKEDRFLPSVCSFFTFRKENKPALSITKALDSKTIFPEGKSCKSSAVQGWDKFRNLKCASGQNPAGNNHCNGCDQCLINEHGTTVPPFTTTQEVFDTTTTTEEADKCNYVCVLERRLTKCFDCECPADYPDIIRHNPLDEITGNYCVKSGAGAQDRDTGDWRCPGNCELAVGAKDSKEYRCIMRMGVTANNPNGDECPVKKLAAEALVANSEDEEEETNMYLLGFIWVNTVLFTYGMSTYQNKRKGDVYRNLLEDNE